MPKFAANLSWLFKEADFLDRFGLAAEAGFSGVEMLFPYDYGKDELAARLKEHELTQVLFNLYPGDFEAGERGIAIFPERRDEFQDAVETGISYAEALNCKRLHCMAGLLPDEFDPFELEATYVSNLKFVTSEAAKAGVTITIENINTKDMPGYYLNYVEQASNVIEKVGADNLKIQMDFYHTQRMEGELLATFEKYQAEIGHLQLADNPGRHEPGTGEINYPFLFKRLDALGYDGWIGCEYAPLDDTRSGLSWLAASLI